MHARLFETIAHEAITGIMVFNAADNRCIYMNRRAREALELDIADGGNASILITDLFPKETRSTLRPFSSLMIATDGYYSNILVRKADGMAIIANLSLKQVEFDSQSSHRLLIFEDITIQRKLQREVESKQVEIEKAFIEILEQNRQLKDLDVAKDRFIALTTHELRTPLSAVVATAEVLELKLYDSDAQRDDLIKTIHEQGRHLMDLVNDILDFAKIRAGKMEFFVEQLDATTLVRKLVSTFDHMAAQGKVKMEVEVSVEPMLVYVDALRFKEVVSNVVNNAIKYNRVEGKVVVTFAPLAEKKALRVTVTDTGPGIPANKLHHVFNEFETVGHVSRHHKGTGLGMPISKRLMQAMGGDLTLESTDGVGSSFFIDIPVEKVLAEELYRARADALGDLAA